MLGCCVEHAICNSTACSTVTSMATWWCYLLHVWILSIHPQGENLCFKISVTMLHDSYIISLKMALQHYKKWCYCFWLFFVRCFLNLHFMIHELLAQKNKKEKNKTHKCQEKTLHECSVTVSAPWKIILIKISKYHNFMFVLYRDCWLTVCVFCLVLRRNFFLWEQLQPKLTNMWQLFVVSSLQVSHTHYQHKYHTKNIHQSRCNHF